MSIQRALEMFCKFINKEYSKGFFSEDIKVVWTCYIMGYWKGLFYIPDEDLDNKYFEVTYDQGVNKFYIDIYNKENHVEVKNR